MNWSRRKGIMLCYPFEEKRLDKYPKPWIVQPKLDGIRCVTRIEGNNISMVTSEGNEITTVPHILDVIHEAFGGTFLRFDGELWSPSLSMMEVQSILRRKEVHPDHEKIRYTVFDAPSIDNPTRPLYERLQFCRGYLGNLPATIMEFIDTTTVYALPELYRFLTYYINSGYEGFVVKSHASIYEEKRSVNWMKLKPHQQDVYLITGYEEEMSQYNEPKGVLGALWCKSNDDTIFKVGTGFTLKQRVDLWRVRDTLSGNFVIVKYQALTPKKIPRFPVFVEIGGDNSESGKT